MIRKVYMPTIQCSCCGLMTMMMLVYRADDVRIRALWCPGCDL